MLTPATGSYITAGIAALALLIGARGQSWYVHGRAHQAYWLALYTFLAYSILCLPNVYLAVDAALGIANATRLLTYCLAVLGIWLFQPWIAHFVDSTHPVARRMTSSWLMLSVVATLVTLFVFASHRGLGPSEPGDFVSRFALNPYVLPYIVIGHGYVGLLLFRIPLSYRHVWPLDHLIDDYALRLRARLAVIATSLGVAYNLLVCMHAGIDALGGASLLRGISQLESSILTAYGATLMLALFGPLDWLLEYWAFCRLYPLWRSIVRTLPGVVRWPARSIIGDILPISRLGSLRFRLRRRVTEIWDGIATLQPYRDARIAALTRLRCLTRGIGGESAAWATEAAVLAAALQAKRRDYLPTQRHPLPEVPALRTLMADAAYLQHVADAMGSTVVREALRAMKDASGYDVPPEDKPRRRLKKR